MKTTNTTKGVLVQKRITFKEQYSKQNKTKQNEQQQQQKKKPTN